MHGFLSSRQLTIACFFLQQQYVRSSGAFQDMFQKVALNRSLVAFEKYCLQKVATDLAIVNVEIAADTIVRSVNRDKSTFEAKLAYVGE